jgi:hypothetical protein
MALIVAIMPTLVALLLLGGCQAYDPGGDVRIRVAAALDARRRGASVEIRGICYSACALKLASGRRVCVAPDATIGIHEVRAAQARDYADGARNDLLTGFFEGLLPRCAADLFASRHGFDSGRITTFSGRDVLNACPQFAVCAG